MISAVVDEVGRITGICFSLCNLVKGCQNILKIFGHIRIGWTVNGCQDIRFPRKVQSLAGWISDRPFFEIKCIIIHQVSAMKNSLLIECIGV